MLHLLTRKGVTSWSRGPLAASASYQPHSDLIPAKWHPCPQRNRLHAIVAYLDLGGCPPPRAGIGRDVYAARLPSSLLCALCGDISAFRQKRQPRTRKNITADIADNRHIPA